MMSTFSPSPKMDMKRRSRVRPKSFDMIAERARRTPGRRRIWFMVLCKISCLLFFRPDHVQIILYFYFLQYFLRE